MNHVLKLLLVWAPLSDEEVPYGVISFNQVALGKGFDTLERVVNQECASLAYEMRDLFPDIDLTTLRIDSCTAWNLDHDTDLGDDQVPLTTQEYVVWQLVKVNSAWGVG